MLCIVGLQAQCPRFFDPKGYNGSYSNKAHAGFLPAQDGKLWAPGEPPFVFQKGDFKDFGTGEKYDISDFKFTGRPAKDCSSTDSSYRPDTTRESGTCEEYATDPQMIWPGPSMLAPGFDKASTTGQHDFAGWCDGDGETRGVYTIPAYMDNGLYDPDWYRGPGDKGSEPRDLRPTCNQAV